MTAEREAAAFFEGPAALLAGGEMVGSTGRRGHGARQSSKRLLCGASMAALMLMTLPTVTRAQDQNRYWDVNGTSVGSGGSGNWDTSTNIWSPSGDGVSGPYIAPWNNLALDNAFFGGTAGTVTLTEPIRVHNLNFSVGGYTLTGGTLTLDGDTPTIIAATGTTFIESSIDGSHGLVKAGNGTLRLDGTNIFSGDISLLSGTLYALTDVGLGAAGNSITTAAGASVTLRINGDPTSRSVTIGDGGTLSVSGSGVGGALISGNGNVNVVAANNEDGIVRLTNDASSYTGTTRFNGCNGVCSVYFSSIADIGEVSSLGAPTDEASGTILFQQSSQYSDNVIYIGDGDSSNRNWDMNGAAAVIRNQGTGALTITGNIDASGTGLFSAETADINLLGILSGVNYNFTVLAGQSITLGGANSFTGDVGISGLVHAPVLAGIGTVSSLGTGSSIQLNNGMLSYTGTGDSSDRAWTVNDAGAILNDGSGALTLSGNLVFDPAKPKPDSLTLGGSFTGSSLISGQISGAGNLISDGAGTWVLGGANSFAGSVTVENGTLRAGNAAAFGAATGFLVNGGTLDLGGYDLTAPSLSGTGGSVALGSKTLTVHATTAQSYGGSITGMGGLTKAGAGTLTLTGQSSYAGATTLGGGTLALDFSGAAAPTSDLLSAASTLVLAGGKLDVIGADGEANRQSFAGTTIAAGSNSIRATDGAGGSVDLDLGMITRTGGLVDFVLPGAGAIRTDNADGALGGWATINGSDYAKVVGGGIIAFDASDYVDKDNAGDWVSGDIVSDTANAPNTPFSGIVAGDVQLGGLRYTAAAASTVTIDSAATLGVDGAIIVAPDVGTNNQRITGGSITGSANGVLGVLQNGGGTFTIDSTIVNNGGATGFTKGGEGSVALTGANTYTGVTTLSSGTLQVNSLANGGIASSIGASGADSSNLVLEGGTLQYTGGTVAVTDRGFTLVNGGAKAPTIQVDSGQSVEFSGRVTSPDDAGLTKTGWGTLVLSNAANDYVGVTTVSGSGGAGASTLAVNTLANGGVASGIGAASGDSSNLVLSSGGRLRYTGDTVAIDRGFTLDSGTGRIDVAQADTTLTINGTAIGGGLIKEGDGTLVLTGTNSYTGSTVVAGGKLVAGSARAFGGAEGGVGVGSLTVNSGATADLANNSLFVGGLYGEGSVLLGTATLNINGGGTFAGAISGDGGISVTRYTQTMTGCNNSYTGVTSITSTLSVDCLADSGQASGIGAASSDPANLLINGTLVYTGGTVTTDRGFTSTGGQISVANAAATLEFTGTTAGAGFTKNGSGTLVLSGVSTRNGTTQISNGTLRAGTVNAFGTGAMGLNNTAGVLLDLNGFDTSVLYLSGGGASGGDIDLGDATLTIAAGNSSNTSYYGGAISGIGGLVKNGSGIQRLTGCASDYTGSTTINSGYLEVSCLKDGGAVSSIGASAADASNLVINGGAFRYIGTGDSTNRQFTLGAPSGSSIESWGTGAVHFTSTAAVSFLTPNVAQALTLGGTNQDDNSFAAQITDNGTGRTSLTKSGVGTWILTNATSDYTGVTRINGGVLGVDKLADGGLASSIGASSAAAANLIIGNNSTLRYTGTGDTTNRLFTLAAGTTFIESSGTGAIVFTDTGPVTLAGNNQTRTIALGGTNTGNNTLAGSIGDAGTGATILAKNDAGTWVLTGENNYSGNTVINDGTLVLGNGGTTGSIVSDTTNLGTLVFNRSDSYTYGGVISREGAVVQRGTGTTVLTGTNTYTGGTTIEAGTLQLGNGGTSGSIVGDVTDNGVLAFNRSDNVTFANVISGTGDVRQIGTGITTLTANHDYSGETHVDAGALVLSGGGTIGNTSLTAVRGAGVMTVAGGTSSLTTGALAVADMSGDSGILNINGGGTVNVTGGSPINVGLGTINVDGAGSALTALTALHVGLDATGVGSVNVSNGGHISTDGGTIGLSEESQGAVLVEGAGSEWVNAGELTVGDAGAGTLTIANGGKVLAASSTIGSGGTGEVLVGGQDSSWENTGRLTVGAYGAGSVRIEDRATVSNADAVIGSSARGDVVVTGPGTTWASTGQLAVGSYDIGTLAIENGAVVTSNQGYIGSGDTANGSVTITGPGSNWSTALNINIGNYGTGALLIEDGARVQAGDGVELGFSATDASGTLTLRGTPATRAILETSHIRAGLGTANLTIDGGIVRATQDNSDFIAGFGTQEAFIGANGAVIDTNDHDIGIAAQFGGTGGLTKTGAGILILSGANAYAGETHVEAGTLLVNGDQSLATGLTSVASGASLGGIGTIGADVTIADGGTLTAGVGGPGTLTINGNLSLASGSILDFQFGEANVVGGALNDLVNVGGNLTLAGTINVTETPGGSFGAGIYRVFNYGGTLTDNGLALGIMPSGSDVVVQTSVAGQVNLVNSGGLTLNFWDGDAGPKFDTIVNGGNGIWQNGAGNNNWTEATGAINAAYTDGAFAIFAGLGGTVTIDNSLGAVSASGAQFASNGYLVTGGDLSLVAPQSVIHVGDGTAAGAGYTATIASALTGAAQLVKTDLGTLILTGTNSYTGGTLIDDGVLSISGDANLGDAAGVVAINQGTLRTTANLTSSRHITLNGTATILTDTGTSFLASGAIGGAGSLTKAGAGTLVLAAADTYTGGTIIAAGTLQVGNGGTAGSLTGDVLNNAALVFNRSDDTSFAGTITGTGSLTQTGGGVLHLTGSSDYSGTTRIERSELRLENGGSINSGQTRLVGEGATLTVTGDGSSFTTTELRLGDPTGGNITLNIEDGGQVVATGTSQVSLGGATIGAPLDVTVNVSGADSLWEVGGNVTVGFNTASTARVNVTDGAMVRSGSLTMGPAFLSMTNPSDVTISGAGSSWTTGGLSVYRGTLSLLDGGRLDAATGRITAASATQDGQGRVLISGTGSELAIASTLDIGGTGKEAIVTVADGGQLNAGGLLTLANIAAGSGTLNIGAAANDTAAAAGTVDVANIAFGPGVGTINFNHTDTAYDFASAMSGAGAINQLAGVTLLSGDSSGFSGLTSVSGGSLYVNDALGGNVAVATGGTLGGIGTIGGNVTVADGALNPGDLGNAPGTLTVNGNLALAAGSTINVNLGKADAVGGALNDLIEVGGDLVLQGTLNVATSAGGSFDPGIYRVINYNGVRTGSGLTIGTIPSPDFYVQTSIDKQVNLVNTAGLQFRYWDGPSSKNDGVIDGGNGVWQRSTGNDNWVDDGSIPNAPFADNAFAVFMGTAGNVAVDGSKGDVTAGGMQFLTDGYVIDGDAITLVGTQAVIRTGDGTAAGAGISATIDAELTGSAQLAKADIGTLILNGANSYTGGTAINGGTLQVSTDANLGDAAGGLGFDGGRLNTTADITSDRAVDLVGAGTFLTDAGTTLALNGAISGAGSLDKIGTGTLALHGVSAFDGSMTVDGGTVVVSDGGSVANYRGHIGSAAGQTGTVVVSGPDSSWTNSSHIYVGESGEGTLTIADGAAVSNAAGTIGLNSGGTGVVTVSGSGSIWTNSQDIRVGALGDGVLTVEAGGIAAATANIALGINAGSRGTATISGAGSKATTASALFVGNAGEGGLTIADGAEVSSPLSFIGYFAGSSGTINIGAAAGDGPATAGTLVSPTLTFHDGDGTLVFNHTDADYRFSTALQSDGAGTHAIEHLAGTTLLVGDSSRFDGATTVSGGTLLVGDSDGVGSLGGTVNVTSGGTLGGSGRLGGNVAIADGGTLAPGNSPGTLTIDGDLALASGSILNFQFGEAGVAGGALNDLVNVGGDLTLDGTINVSVSTGGSFGPGIYRVFNYNGALTDNGLTLGTMPGGDVSVQTAVAGQVNLVNTGGLLLSFWDGAAGPKNNSLVDGGDGVWRVAGGGNNWANAAGAVNGDYMQDSFAIFSAAPGTVTIDNSGGDVLSTGMQFASDGYVIAGDPLTLTGGQAIIQVGDSSAAGAGYTATIDAALVGAAQLVKTDAGTLVLGGVNSYAGGTAISGGVLRIASDANLGDLGGGLRFDGGTLQTTADIASARSIDLASSGGFRTDAGTTLTLTGTLAGPGGFGKSGDGTLVLGGSGSYAGATIGGGVLFVDGDYSGATGTTDVLGGATLGGTGTIGGNVAIADGAILAPGTGSAGMLTISGNLSLSAASQLGFEFGEANTAGGGLNDLVNVGGDLTLDGVLDVAETAGGTFGPGLYRVFNYGGALTDNGLTLGALPAGADVTVQTSIAGQVNLVNAEGLTLNFWDGAAGPQNDGVVNGGDGIWQSGTDNDRWTDEAGNLNAAYADGSFAIFGGTAGTVTIDNSLGDVTASGMQFGTGGYVIGGDGLTLTGATATIRVGDGSIGGADYVATINSAIGGAAQLVKTDAGTLILGGNNGYTGGTLITGGAIRVASDANLGDANGDVTLNGGALETSADITSARGIVLAGNGTIATSDGTAFTFDGQFSGTGALTKAGSGTLLVTADNSGFAGDTKVTAGTLALQGVLGGGIEVGADGRLEGRGRAGSIVNAGVVAPGRGIGTLTVAGDYKGNDGTLEIEAELGGDGSDADRLVVGGATSGSTRVTVTNRGGLGAQTVEGIKIVDVTGASDGQFLLDGDYLFDGDQAVIAGAYGYRLYKNGITDPQDGDWYLRSSLLNPAEPEESGPLYQPGVPVYEAYVGALQALNGLPTLQQRVGNRAWAGAPTTAGTGIWGRIESERNRPEALVSTTGLDRKVNSWQMQIGADTQLHQRADGAMLIGGLTAHYGKADSSVTSLFGNGTIDTRGYGFGATLTWYGPKGLYVDGQAQLSWFDSDLESSVLGTLVDGNKGRGRAFSLEIGKRAQVDRNLSVTPQVQMSYTHVGFDRFADPAEASVSALSGESLKSRWGLSIDHQKSWGDNGAVRRSHLYALVNLSYEWLGDARVDVSGTPIRNADDRLWGEFALGGSLTLGRGLTLYTEASGNTSLRDFGGGYSFKGTAGVRLAF